MSTGNDSDGRWSRGLDAYASQFEIPTDEVLPHLTKLLGQPMAVEAVTAAGGAWNDDALSLRDRSLVVLAALAAQGGVESRMRTHVGWAVAHGATRAELEALVALLAVYAGYPKASIAAEVVRDELGKLEGEGS